MVVNAFSWQMCKALVLEFMSELNLMVLQFFKNQCRSTRFQRWYKFSPDDYIIMCMLEFHVVLLAYDFRFDERYIWCDENGSHFFSFRKIIRIAIPELDGDEWWNETHWARTQTVMRWQLHINCLKMIKRSHNQNSRLGRFYHKPCERWWYFWIILQLFNVLMNNEWIIIFFWQNV